MRSTAIAHYQQRYPQIEIRASLGEDGWVASVANPTIEITTFFHRSARVWAYGRGIGATESEAIADAVKQMELSAKQIPEMDLAGIPIRGDVRASSETLATFEVY